MNVRGGNRAVNRPITGVATAIVAVGLGLVPAVSTGPVLTAAAVDYLRGTNIGWTATDEQYRAFVGQVLEGTATPADPPTPAGYVDYDAGFWPISHGLIFDLTWDASVAQGVQNLGARDPQGDVIFGLSQGAVVASQYKAQHPEGTGNTFVLVANPARPNGGLLSRFAGLHVPIIDITFTGATPDNGDTTVDVARQYDGWADFPTYPLNLLATANAILGMVLVHGQTQTELTAADIEAAKAAGNWMYYQQHGDTTYYLIRTPRLPLLMPLSGIVPDPILDALDTPLRAIVEQGYDRTDYSQPTTARLFPPIGAVQAVAATPQVALSTAAVPSAPRVKTPKRPKTLQDRAIAPTIGAVSPAAKTTTVDTKNPSTGSSPRTGRPGHRAATANHTGSS